MNKLTVPFFATILFLLSSLPAKAVTLFCEDHYIEIAYGGASRTTTPAMDFFMLTCRTAKGETYGVTAWGRGLGLQAQVAQAVVISCPRVKKSMLNESNVFKGVSVSASAVVGATVAVFRNRDLGVCTMAGLNVGLGAALSADHMVIEKE